MKPAVVVAAPPAIPPVTTATIDELLKTRHVLTVDHDGKGEYKTIQEALNKVLAGQIINVKAGKKPYRETPKHGALPANVALISLDGGTFPAGYSQPINFQTPFPLPKVKYFDFESVLPGRYIAYVSVLGQGWYTKKEEVTVSTHMKFISLQLVHKM